MENLEEPKPDPKGKAVASFWLGLASAAPLVVFLIQNLFFYNSGSSLSSDPPGTGISTLLIVLPIIWMVVGGSIGLIFGIMGIRSTKRNFAIAGIALSIIALLPAILVIYFFNLLMIAFIIVFVLWILFAAVNFIQNRIAVLKDHDG